MTDDQLGDFVDGAAHDFRLRDGTTVRGALFMDAPFGKPMWYVLGSPSPTSQGKRTDIRAEDVVAVDW
jgi:hypothetical protein